MVPTVRSAVVSLLPVVHSAESRLDAAPDSEMMGQFIDFAQLAINLDEFTGEPVRLPKMAVDIPAMRFVADVAASVFD